MSIDRAARPTHHLAYIDALRGIAVALVIAVHVAGEEQIGGLLGRALEFGAKGVQLFYVISALTLMMSMSKRSNAERHPTLNFFLRRVFRIAPAFYLVLLVYCALGWWGSTASGVAPVPGWQAAMIALFINGWRPDIINSPVMGQWSIAVEFMFYAVLPFCFPLLRSFRHAVWGWWFSLAVYVASYPLAARLAGLEGFRGEYGLHDFAYWWFPSQLPIFLCGVGLYFVLTERLPAMRAMVPYLSGAVLIVAAHKLWPDTGLLPLVGVALMAGVMLLARHPVPLLVNPATRFLGKVSFSAYLCHPLLLMLVRRWMGFAVAMHSALGGLLVFVVLLALVCPVAWLMFVAIEQPGQALGRRLIARMEAPAETAAI